MFKKFIFMLITLCFLFHKTALLSSGEAPYYTVEGISSFTLSSDEKEIILDNGLNDVLILNRETNQIVDKFRIPFRGLKVKQLKNSPMNQSFAESTEGIYYPMHGWEIRNCSNIRAIAVSPDNRYIAVGSRGVILTVYDRLKKRIIKTYKWDWISIDPSYTYDERRDQVIVASVAFSEDGKYIAAGACDGRVRIISTDTFELKKTFWAHNRCVQYIRIIGNQVYTISQLNKSYATEREKGLKEIKIWNLNDFQLKTDYRINSNKYEPVPQISRDGKLLISHYKVINDDFSNEEEYNSFIILSKVETGETFKTLFIGKHIIPRNIAISPDNSIVAVSNGSLINLYEINSGILIKKIDTRNLLFMLNYRGYSPLGIDFNLNSLAFSSDSKFLFVCGAGFKMQVFEVNTGRLIYCYQVSDNHKGFKHFVYGIFKNPTILHGNKNVINSVNNASSYLVENRISHNPSNIIDRNAHTAWIPDRNNEHSSIYPYIIFEVKQGPNHLFVLPGFGASEELWFKNNRVSSLMMEFNSKQFKDVEYYSDAAGTRILLKLQKEHSIIPYNKYQYFNLSQFYQKMYINSSDIKYVKITILDTDNMKALYNDTAISEIMMFR